MPVSKLKNLAILILLLANAALICLLVPRQLEKHAQTEALFDSLHTLCAEQGVTLQEDCFDESLALYALEFHDRSDAEAAALAVLDPDGERTSAQWEDGRLALKLQQQKEVSDLRGHTKSLLKNMQFQTFRLEEPARVSPGIFDVTAQQSVLGVPVFSEGLTFRYANNCLRSVQGSFFAGPVIRTDDAVCCTAPEAVVAFLGARVDLGWVGSTVVRLEQGYLSADTKGLVRLIPCWLLTTDTGSYYVNGLDGSVQIVP